MTFDGFTSVIIYFVVFSLSATLLYLGGKKKLKTLTILGLLIVVLFSAFRLNAGTDTATYRTFYEQVSTSTVQRSMERLESGEMEPFIILTAMFGGFIGVGDWFMFAVFALITVYFLYKTAQKLDEKNYWILYGACLLMVYPNSFNTMRQVAAMSVLSYLLSAIIQSIIDKRRVGAVKTILLSLFAISLHYSSIALIPVLLVPYITKRFGYHKTFYVMGVLAIFIITLYKPALQILASAGILSPKHYITFINTEGSFLNFNFLICGVLTLVSAFHYKNHRNNNHLNKHNLIILMAGVAYSAIGFYSGYLGRLADFFWPFAILMLWQLITETQETPLKKIAIMYAIAIAYFILAFVIMGTNQLIPYDIIGG